MQDAEELSHHFHRHRAGLAGAVRTILGAEADAQEVVQDAFLKALAALRRDPACRVSTAWIFTITMNLARDRGRRRGRRGTAVPLDEVEPMKMTTADPAPHERMVQGEALSAARDAIGALPEADREVFLLRVSGELSFEAIAEALSIPLGTAKTRMRRALQVLRAGLSGYGTVDMREGHAQ